MYLWISALLGALLSLGVPGVSPDTLVGTARVSGPVFLNGTKVNQQVVITDGDRLVTGPGGIASLNLSSTRSEERRGGKECRSRWSPYH